MRVKSILLVIALFFLASCTYEQPVNNDPGPSIFIIDENDIESQIKIFVVEEKNPLFWFEETKEIRYQINLRRSIAEDEDELEEFEIRTKLKNVRRSFDNEFGERELIIGFDEELDNPDFKEVDY